VHVRRFGLAEESKRDMPVRRCYPANSGLVGLGQRAELFDELSGRPHGEEQSGHPASVALGCVRELTSGTTMSP